MADPTSPAEILLQRMLGGAGPSARPQTVTAGGREFANPLAALKGWFTGHRQGTDSPLLDPTRVDYFDHRRALAALEALAAIRLDPNLRRKYGNVLHPDLEALDSSLRSYETMHRVRQGLETLPDARGIHGTPDELVRFHSLLQSRGIRDFTIPTEWVPNEETGALAPKPKSKLKSEFSHNQIYPPDNIARKGGRIWPANLSQLFAQFVEAERANQPADAAHQRWLDRNWDLDTSQSSPIISSRVTGRSDPSLELPTSGDLADRRRRRALSELAARIGTPSPDREHGLDPLSLERFAQAIETGTVDVDGTPVALLPENPRPLGTSMQDRGPAGAQVQDATGHFTPVGDRRLQRSRNPDDIGSDLVRDELGMGPRRDLDAEARAKGADRKARISSLLLTGKDLDRKGGQTRMEPRAPAVPGRRNLASLSDLSQFDPTNLGLAADRERRNRWNTMYGQQKGATRRSGLRRPGQRTSNFGSPEVAKLVGRAQSLARKGDEGRLSTILDQLRALANSNQLISSDDLFRADRQIRQLIEDLSHQAILRAPGAGLGLPDRASASGPGVFDDMAKWLMQLIARRRMPG